MNQIIFIGLMLLIACNHSKKQDKILITENTLKQLDSTPTILNIEDSVKKSTAIVENHDDNNRQYTQNSNKRYFDNDLIIDDNELDSLKVENQYEQKDSVVKSENQFHTNTLDSTSTNSISTSPSHRLFDEFLRRFVSEHGMVDYNSIVANPQLLDDYIEILKKTVPSNSWSRNQSFAYWVNSYNAFTVKLIVDHYPIYSIKDIHNGNPWDDKWIKLGNNIFSLNEIEHDIIRKSYKDPRIHFVLNCAAKSCPPLSNFAFTAENLESSLDKQTRLFINNPTYNSLSSSSINISKIFEWYKVDFDNIITFLNKYSNIFIDQNALISYNEYNWELNSK